MLTIVTSVLLVNPYYVSTTSALLRLALAMLGVDAKAMLRARAMLL